MTAGTSPIFGTTPKTQVTSLANADGTGNKTIYTAGANGTILLGIGVTTSDTSPNDLNLYEQVAGAGSALNIGGKRVPLGSGDHVASPIAAVQLLDRTQIPSLLPDGTLQLGALDVLQVAAVAAVTSGKQANIFVQALDY